MMPPLPEKFPIAPDNEVVDSESELPLAQSPTQEVAEPSEGQTRKRSWSESSDASTPPTPWGTSFLERHDEDEGALGAPFSAVPLWAMAPQPPAKKNKKEKATLVFNLSDIGS